MLALWILCSVLCLVAFFHNNRIVFKFGRNTISFNLIISAIMCFIIILLMTANRTGYDADAYTRFFNLVKSTKMNPYDYTYDAFYRVELCILPFYPKLTYPEFHALLLLVTGLFCVYPVIKKYSVDPAVVLSLYVLSGTFAADGMQSKNFVAVCILVATFYFYSDYDKKKWHIFAYYICLFLAMLFHFSFAIYVFLPVTKTNRFRKYGRIFPVIGGMLYFIFLYGGGFTTAIVTYISRIQFLSKAENYGMGRAGIRSLVPFTIYFAILTALYYFTGEKRNQALFRTVESDEKRKNLASIAMDVRYIWELMGLFLPVLIYANATYRFYRNLYIPVFIVITNSVLSIKNKNRRKIGIILLLGVAFAIFIYPILLRQHIDIYESILKGYWFWQEG